jgi:hypothetical protein
MILTSNAEIKKSSLKLFLKIKITLLNLYYDKNLTNNEKLTNKEFTINLFFILMIIIK